MVKQRSRYTRKIKLIIMFFLISIIIVLSGIWLYTQDNLYSDTTDIENIFTPDDAFQTMELPDRAFENDIVLPVGLLLTTQARAAYESGALRLIVPRLQLDCVVGDNTLMEDLEKGPGLYKYSQLPDIYNTNVSIAAHRDVAGCEFYDLDKMGSGDYIYLVYQDQVFQYRYLSTEIIDPDNWDPVRTFPDCRVTLITCDPIGTTLRRMVVVGELVEWKPYSQEFNFV